MTNYTVFFELFGKKMKTTVLADSPEQAKQKVKDRIIFHKIKPADDTFNNLMDLFKMR